MGDWNLGRTDIFAMGIQGNGVVKIILKDKPTTGPLTVSKDYYGSNGTVNKGEDKPFILFTLNAGESEQRLAELFLLGNLKKVKGCYKDQVDVAYLLPLTGEFECDFKMVERLERLCKYYKQESYLVVDKKRRATLVYLSPHKTECLGTFQSSNPAEAIASGNWTLDGSTFWIVK